MPLKLISLSVEKRDRKSSSGACPLKKNQPLTTFCGGYRGGLREGTVYVGISTVLRASLHQASRHRGHATQNFSQDNAAMPHRTFRRTTQKIRFDTSALSLSCGFANLNEENLLNPSKMADEISKKQIHFINLHPFD